MKIHKENNRFPRRLRHLSLFPRTSILPSRTMEWQNE